MSQIQTALNAAMRDICKIGIGKTQKNEAQNYRFRGVEQAMNEMSPIMVNHGITVASSYSELNVTERAKDGGKATRFVTLKGAFTFRAEDDSSIQTEAFGEAMDSGDKAVIKAQSVAYRTAIFQLFVVPTMSMDSELDDSGDGGEDPILDEFREAAMGGTASLKKRYEKEPPPAAWWARHNASLKEAAGIADKAVA